MRLVMPNAQRATLLCLVCLALGLEPSASGAPAKQYASAARISVAQVQFRSEQEIADFKKFHKSSLSEPYAVAFPDLIVSWPTTARAVTSIMLPTALYNRTISYLKRKNLNFQLSTMTLQQAMRRQPEVTKQALMYESVRKITGYFPRYSEIMKWMDTLAAAFPDLVQLTDIGKSFEGRRLVVIKIGSIRKSKRMIFLESGIHAREWIVPSTCIWIIDKLMHDYAYGVRDVKKLLDEIYDFGFIILANPDGYEYTHTSNRFWRRTRSVRQVQICPTADSCLPSQMKNVTCIGADANRNWDIHFNEIGTAEGCSDVYPGPKAFSEIEMEKLAEYVAAESFSIRFYLALHSYGQMWFIPPGFKRVYLPEHELMLRFSKIAVDAIKKAGGPSYALGTHAELLYMVSGSSADWVIENGVTFSATVELPPLWRKDGVNLGTRGFLANPSDINETGRHMLVGLKALADALYEYDTDFKK